MHTRSALLRRMLKDGQQMRIQEGRGLHPAFVVSTRGRKPKTDPLDLWAAGATPGTLKPGSFYREHDGHCDRRKTRIIFACPTHGAFFFRQPCSKLDCDTCTPKLDARKGARAHEQIGGAPALAFVLTLPLQWGPYIDADRAVMVRKLATQCIEEVCAVWLRPKIEQRYRRKHGLSGAVPMPDQVYPRVGGVAAVHPAGDKCHVCGAVDKERSYGRRGKCPKCGATARPFPHVDLVMPRIATDPTGGEPITIPRFMPKAMLRLLKRLWWEVLETLSRRSTRPDGTRELCAPPLSRGDHTANVNIRPIDKAAKVQHRLRYCLRGWPAWRNTAIGRALRTSQWGAQSPNAGGRVGSAARDAIDWWRAYVQGQRAETEDLVCPRCDTPLELLDICHARSEKWREGWSKHAKDLAEALEVRRAEEEAYARESRKEYEKCRKERKNRESRASSRCSGASKGRSGPSDGA